MIRRFSLQLCLTALLAPAWAAAAPTSADEVAARELGRIKVKPLREISGIAVSRVNPDVVWMHNDGEVKHIYAVKTSGQVAAQLRTPPGIEDLEDIAIGPGPDPDRDYLYLGDIGDNDADRRTVQVMRILEPKIGATGLEKSEQVHIFSLIYPDGPHDAEALLVDPATGDVLVATKEEQRTTVYLARTAEAGAGGPIVLRPIAQVTAAQVSAGDISRDGALLALRSESRGWLWERRPGEAFEATLARKPLEIPVLGRKQGPNGESLAFVPEGDAYLTMSEGKNQELYLFPAPLAPGPGK